MPFARMSPRAIGRMGSLKRDDAIRLSSGTACLTISERVRCGPIEFRHGVPHDIREGAMRRASNSIRDGHANASSPPRQISSANTNSSQIPHRWIVNPDGNCLRGGMAVVRNRPSKGPQPNRAGASAWIDVGVGERVSIHMIANSLQRGMFRLMCAWGLTRAYCPAPCSRHPVVAGATFAKDDKLGVDPITPVPTGANCVTPADRAAN
jgi:hypothetical protein